MHDMEIHAHGYEKQLRGRGIELTYQSLVSQQLHMIIMPMRSYRNMSVVIACGNAPYWSVLHQTLFDQSEWPCLLVAAS